jgi:hypothetical protein
VMLLIGGLILIGVGIVAVFASYHSLIHRGHTETWMKNLLLLLVVGVQLAYIPYISLMVDIGLNTSRSLSDQVLISQAYDPTDKDVNFVAAMGILAVITYAFSLVGGLAFFLFAMHAYVSGTPELRPGTYYRGRMLFYSGVLALAGLTQLLLGSYIQKNFTEDSGKLADGPIGVAVFVVNFPGMNIVIGAIQMLFGIWGMGRALKVTALMIGKDDPDTSTYSKNFQMAMFFAWFLQLVLQVITQIGYVPGTVLSEKASIVFCLSFGLNLMPAYLDYKMRSIPDTIDKVEYYGMMANEEPLAVEDAPEPKNLHDDDDDSPPTAKHDLDEEAG